LIVSEADVDEIADKTQKSLRQLEREIDRR